VNPSSSALASIRQHAEARLRELEPYLREAERLRRVLAAIEDELAPTPARLPSGRAPQGLNKRRILAVVRDHPGITPAEVGRMTGMKRTVVASTMTRLKRTGELEPCGRGARLPAGHELVA
jgi:hypothetical protein